MSNFTKRLIFTLVSIPLIFIILFLPQKTHIILIIVFGVVITFLGSFEISTLIYKKGIKLRRFFLPIINLIVYIFAYCYANNFFNIQSFKFTWIFFTAFIIVVISIIYASDIAKKDLSRSFEKVAYSLLGLMYIGVPSFFAPFILNIDNNPVNPVPIFNNVESFGTLTGSLMGLFFLILVLPSDIFAYVFGMAFGRNNVINLEASPKKSWAGYIGGYFSVFVFVGIFHVIFDVVFELLDNPWWFYYLFAAISGIVVPIGDLVESVFKRSANVKDSGNLVLGRGGILDSVDTMLYFIPIYFMMLQVYYLF